MSITEAITAFNDAVEFATSCIVDDPDPRNERESADGELYLVRILTAVTDSALLIFDPKRPAFMDMLDSVRYLGASGPDIDYDVAMVEPGTRYRITGTRGEATFVGICVYAGAGEGGATAIAASIDVDTIVEKDGSFSFEFDRPNQARVIVRQYFHDRSIQRRGNWTIERIGAEPAPEVERRLPTTAELDARIMAAARSVRWNAQLNRLWTPERRAFRNEFIRQTPEEVVAVIPNPDVIYAFTWWEMADPASEVLRVDFTPPQTRYWSLQVCDRWFQCFPDDRSNLNDQQCVPNPDGSFTLVLADRDPGVPNWIDTRGHHLGTMFFRWLHADIEVQPTVRVVPRAELRV